MSNSGTEIEATKHFIFCVANSLSVKDIIPMTNYVWQMATWPPHFLCSKNKIGKEKEKRKSFKTETIKRLSPRRKCYCFSNGLEFKYFLLFHRPSTLKSILPVLPNLALICTALHRKLISLRWVLGGIFSYVLLAVMSFLVLFSSICLKHVNANIKKNEFDIAL